MKYSSIIRDFKNFSLNAHGSTLDIEQYVESEPDQFEAFMLARNLLTAKDQAESVFEREVVNSKSFAYYFFDSYRKNILQDSRLRKIIPSGIIPRVRHIRDTEDRFGQEEGTPLSEVLKTGKRIVILGPSGSGKTTALRQLITTTDLCSIFIDLRKSDAKSIKESINAFLRGYRAPFDYDTLEKVGLGNILFLFDAVDQMAAYNLPEFERLLQTEFSFFQQGNIIITSRYSYRHQAQEELGLETYIVQPPSKEEISEFVKNNAGEGSVKILKALDNDRFFVMMQNLHHLNVVCDLVRSGKDLPQNEALLYRNLLDATEEGQLRQQDEGGFKVPFPGMRELMRAVAYQLQKDRLSGMKKDGLKCVIGATKLTASWHTVIDEAMRRGFLELVIGGDEYAFTHSTWESYFAAEYLSGDWKKYFPAWLEYDWRDDSAVILAGLLEGDDRQRFITLVRKAASDLAGECLGLDWNEAEQIPEASLLQESKVAQETKMQPVQVRIGQDKTFYSESLLLLEAGLPVYVTREKREIIDVTKYTNAIYTGKEGFPDTISGMLDDLGSLDDMKRRYARAALQEECSQETTNLLVELVCNSAKSVEARSDALEVLYRVTPRETEKLIDPVLDHKDVRLRLKALELVYDEYPHLFKHLTDSRVHHALLMFAETIDELGPEERFRFLNMYAVRCPTKAYPKIIEELEKGNTIYYTTLCRLLKIGWMDNLWLSENLLLSGLSVEDRNIRSEVASMLEEYLLRSFARRRGALDITVKKMLSLYREASKKEIKEDIFDMIQETRSLTGRRFLGILGEEFA